MTQFDFHFAARTGVFVLASLYSSAGSAELPADNIISQIEAAARGQLLRQAASAKLVEPAFEVSVVKTTRPLAACRAPLGVEALDTRQLNRMRFAAVCAGADGWKYEFVVRAAISARVAVASVPVAAGAALTAADMVLERRDISIIPDSVPELVPVLGLASRRSLRAGEVLRMSQLAALPVVKRGDLVRIVARRSQIEVSMSGEALDAGAQDAVVRVRNAASGTVIRARVVSAGTVEPVDLAGGNQSPD